MSTYYNDSDPYVVQWLRNLIAAGHLPAGEVDERSIVEVQPDGVDARQKTRTRITPIARPAAPVVSRARTPR